ncbi:uridylate kinase [Methylomonas rhizoryzae]|uniref:amino acid kinase family protein n=1 Tax=Methylomonas sp. HYX-M1 TaxID=3139307 RepID=UPI0012329127
MLKVVKLGGSLLSAGLLPTCLKRLAGFAGRIVVVPGGGMFADQVRSAQQQYGFDDGNAHYMAVLAMQQMAYLIHAMDSRFRIMPRIDERCDERLQVWAPQIDELDAAGIPAGWEVTSDSLSAWAARQLAADELLLVKTCPVPQTNLQTLQVLGILDAAFSSFAANAGCKISVIDSAGLSTLS